VFLLYSTRTEGIRIIREANVLGLTKSNYVWIVTQSVIGASLSAPKDFPVGMLGVHYPTDPKSMIEEIGPAMSVFASALNTLSKKEDMTLSEKISIIRSNISCHSHGDVRWNEGNISLFILYQKKSSF
jgi:ionotropic glutamate receptor NMDA 2B